MSLALTKQNLLIDRATMLRTVRDFFFQRDVCEVDCPALVLRAPLDSNIDVMSVTGDAFLHTSPEYAMKRLLSQGSGDIYFLGHVYRLGELGPRHNPEFTMIEVYRQLPYEEFIQETCAIISLFLGELPIRLLTYRDAFISYIGIDPFANHDFAKIAKNLGIETTGDNWDKDSWLHLLLSHAIEPKLGQNELTVLHHYPASQAALSRLIEEDGHLVAERFEIYHKGIELSNGYHELTDALEQRHRFEKENALRTSCGKEPYALDEKLLAALESGIPDCCGVSLGFDRLMLLRRGAKQLKEVLPLAWEDL